MKAKTMEGRCLCGGVTITLHAPKDHVEICHCNMCRRWGGAFYAALEGDSFTIDNSELVSTYQSSAWAERGFCSKCGSNLWYRFLPTGNRSFLAGLFTEADDLPVGQEIFVDEKVAWIALSGDHPRLTGEEIIEQAESAGFSFD
ncbi:aldehyde-activating protein [Aurantiacibacter atlanticus]|uniref:Aldehyde-activating protein n=1 Tax=Aurantiacibacter atlanticus TaxID=1648404 RepID=A0A0H4VFZ9_9SPHN|nr:GFA family protein [Aurantiacibacter atlanticus]AKQ42034.1 aldehyde-activating protein [Aurantiacibacter atlanticus]MDF1834658.1 GFA family protein [Alteraurantiacibacter sp. bin_em_oilr2.035]